MKRRSYLMIVALVAALVLGQISTAFAQQKRKVLIGFNGPSTHQAANDRANAVRSMGGDVHHAFHVMPVVSAELPDAAIAQLQKRADVTYVEDDGQWHASGQTTSWGINRIYARDAWSVATGAGVNVAVLDSGIDFNHEDLAGNYAGGVNYVGKHPKTDGSTDQYLHIDIYGHGSHCAGIIAAVNNEIGVVGVAPEARLWAVKVLDDNGSASWTDVAQGVEWCIDQGDIRVMSISLQGGYSTTLDNACAAAYAADILIVACAGNYGDAVSYPAAYDSVMAVSNIGSNNQLDTWSNYGPEIELAAPGVKILSTVPGDEYALKSGTSMACPHVSGVAALLWESMDSPTASSIRDQLTSTAQDIGLPPEEQGYGLVNAAAAVGVTPEPFTDLAITRMWVPSSYQIDGINIAALVENVGNEVVPAGVEVTFKDITDSITIGTRTTLNALGLGEWVVLPPVFWNTTNSSLGIHTLEASHNLPDDNPANDSMTDTFLIEPPFTDIAITDIIAPSSAVQGDVVPVDVTVKNMSNHSVVGDAITVTLTDTYDAVETPIDSQSLTITNLQPGRTETLSFDWDTSTAGQGIHTLTAYHDFIDHDESNDSKSTTVDVIEAGIIKYMYGSISFLTAGRHLKTIITVEESDQTPVAGIEVYAELDGELLPVEVTDDLGQITYTIKGGASSNHDVLLYDLLDTRIPEVYVADGLPVTGLWRP